MSSRYRISILIESALIANKTATIKENVIYLTFRLMRKPSSGISGNRKKK